MVNHGGQRTGEMTRSHHSQEGCRQQQGAGPEGEQERHNQDPREGQWGGNTKRGAFCAVTREQGSGSPPEQVLT